MFCQKQNTNHDDDANCPALRGLHPRTSRGGRRGDISHLSRMFPEIKECWDMNDSNSSPKRLHSLYDKEEGGRDVEPIPDMVMREGEYAES